MIANEREYGTQLRMLSKMDLRVQMDAKSGQLKNESKSEVFSAPDDSQERTNGTTKGEIKVSLYAALEGASKISF